MSHWVNVWRCISDCAHVLPTVTPFHWRCLEAFSYALYQTGVREDGNPKLWCVVQHDEVTTLLLNIGTLQSSTDIHVYLFLVQTQLRYIYLLLSHHHSPTSSDFAIMTTPFSAHTLEQRHLSTRLHSSHPPAEICSEWLLDLDEQLFMENSNPWLWFQGYLLPLVPARVAVLKATCQVTKIWPHPKAKSCLSILATQL